MKKIVLYVFILVLPAFIAFLGLNFAYKQTNHWKAAYYNVDRFNHVPTGIKVCNIGTSHGCWGLKWEDYPELNAFNFANSAQSFYMDLIMLKHFKSKIAEDAIVLIPLSFHQVFSYWNIWTESPNGEAYYKELYQHFLYKQEFPYWDSALYIKGVLFPIINFPVIATIFNDISEEEISRFYGKDGIFKKYLSEENMKMNIDQTAIFWFFGCNEKIEEKSFQKNIDAVCKIVDYCHENSWNPVFITLPVYDYFYEAFDEKAKFIKKGFYEFSTLLCEKYPDIPYFDYSHDSQFSPNIKLFKDADHLNNVGAERFTARIITDLRKNGYLY